MNSISLAQSNIKNQQQPSWIDDPFDLGATAFKGLTPMCHTRNLSNFAETLVSEYASFENESYHLSISDLSDSDLNELVRLYLEFSGRETTECVYGDDLSINSEYTCALLAMLQDDCKETRDQFAYVTRTNVITYYKESLNEILSAACDNLLHIQMQDQGYYAHQDLEHGDIFWSKF